MEYLRFAQKRPKTVKTAIKEGYAGALVFRDLGETEDSLGSCCYRYESEPPEHIQPLFAPCFLNKKGRGKGIASFIFVFLR